MTVKSSFGFSLVELMVALVISSILMGGVLTIMSTSKKTYSLQSELSILQDNARFLIDQVTREIRMAGYAGCSSTATSQNNPFVNSTNDALLAANGFPASDNLSIFNYGQLIPLASQPQMQPFSEPPLANPIQLRNGFIPDKPITQVFISDCSAAPQPYEATAEDPEKGDILVLNGSYPLNNFRGGIQLFNGRNETLYQVRRQPLGLYRCQDDDPNGQCDDTQQLDLPFIEGVESLQVRYGINTGGGNVQFTSTTTTADKVVAVRISLLMRTPHRRMDLNASNEDFYLDGPNLLYNPDKDNPSQEQGYRHRLFTTTIAIRNASAL